MSAVARERIELLPSRALAVAVAAGGAAIAALGVALAIGGASEGRLRDGLFAGIVTVGAGAYMVVYALPIARSPQAQAVADERGLHHLPRFGRGFTLAWEEVAALGRVRRGKHSALGIWLRDRERLVAAKPALARPLLRLGHALGRCDLRAGVFASRGTIEAFARRVAGVYGVELR